MAISRDFFWLRKPCDFWTNLPNWNAGSFTKILKRKNWPFCRGSRLECSSQFRRFRKKRTSSPCWNMDGVLKIQWFFIMLPILSWPKISRLKFRQTHLPRLLLYPMNIPMNIPMLSPMKQGPHEDHSPYYRHPSSNKDRIHIVSTTSLTSTIKQIVKSSLPLV